MVHIKNTIAAISTPPGKGGIAVVRISGEQAFSIIESIFHCQDKQPLQKSHRAYHGWIVDGNESIDEVVAILFKKPNSYTGEDVVEISCHGGVYVSQRILEIVIDKGARISDPGEFTQRAFINGKMDLSQAEAVADLIQAQTEASRRVAVYQLEGRLSEEVNRLRNALIQICSLLEIELDFGEEDIELIDREEIGKRLRTVREELDRLIQSYRRGKVCREGVRMVILGKPNVGKSSILNVLIEKERAIVTEIPGTTRDLVEDVLDIEGILFTVIDTAGIRDIKNVRDPIEREGIRRTEDVLKTADLVLFVFDNSQSLDTEDEAIIRIIQDENKRAVHVINKVDLKSKIEKKVLAKWVRDLPLVKVSALTKQGISDLVQILYKEALFGDLPEAGELILNNIRHYQSIVKAKKCICLAEESLDNKLSQEFIALDIRGALEGIGEITGQTTPEDILNHIFAGFCIGK